MSKKILIVDDEPELTKVMQARLAAHSYEIISAENGLKALEQAKAESPDLILLDVMMPKMHGLDVLRNLKNNPETEGIPVIMLTAKDDKESVIKARSLGAKEYISKPFNLEALLDAVRRHLS
jgi:DNA-binding response OmpR family regulator